MTDTTRDAFEAQICRQFPTIIGGVLTGRNKTGNYSSLVVHHAYLAWQAATLAAAPQWLPIADAPRDGTQMLVPSQWAGLDADIASYDANGWWSCKLELQIDEPTSWQPLPPIATPQGTGGNHE